MTFALFSSRLSSKMTKETERLTYFVALTLNLLANGFLLKPIVLLRYKPLELLTIKFLLTGELFP